jgi:hypothetical protein
LRFTRLGKNKPAEFGVTCGLGIGIVTSITNIIIYAASSDFFMLGFIISYIIGMILFVIGIQKIENDWKKLFLFSVIPILLPTIMLSIFLWFALPSISVSLSLADIWQKMSYSSSGDLGPAPTDLFATTATVLQIILSLGALPLWTICILAIHSRIKKIPVSVGVVRGMASYAIPIASLLAVVFALAMPFLAHRQDMLREQVREMATNEIVFYKRLAPAER